VADTSVTVQRFALLPAIALRDTVTAPAARYLPASPVVWDEAVDAGMRWLRLTHDVTGRRGSSKGFSLLFGWFPPFPETTGYIIGTFVAHARRSGCTDDLARAREMGEWEVEVQRPDGGVIEGLLTATPKPSTVFNTGMVVHGWLDLHQREPHPAFLEAAARGGEFLVGRQDADGAWRGPAEYCGIPHVYNTSVSWALMRLADVTGDERYRRAARRQLDWTLRRQHENGWFEACFFKPGMLPSTHSLAYTIRGLLESFALGEDHRYLHAACRPSEILIRKLEVLGQLPATWDEGWRPGSRYECLTGIAQLGAAWLRLYELTGDERWLNAGIKATELAAARQTRIDWPPVRGALAGSMPIYDRYAPLQYPNWATKFLVDALLLRERLLPQ
jgi:uncharacterized protein YyaL (SSP411 family)